ncbi:MAG: hypothetical protein PF569_08000 [Candidatus Woesearchaeota archaeon]|jgi:hypothetical protein|nr:hypothetical protein [Candidatus Woesearchaeota archaeon]
MNNNIKQEEVKFDEALGINYTSGKVLKKNVNFVFPNGTNFETNILSGVRSKKINKSLFSTNLSSNFKNFTEVKVSPALKMGKKRYSKGFLISTDKGRTLFLPTETKNQIEAKWKRFTNGRIIQKGDHQTGIMRDPYLDGHRQALPPGKRSSRNGKEYSEYRKNRSDLIHNKYGDF